MKYLFAILQEYVDAPRLREECSTYPTSLEANIEQKCFNERNPEPRLPPANQGQFFVIDIKKIENYQFIFKQIFDFLGTIYIYIYIYIACAYILDLTRANLQTYVIPPVSFPPMVIF